MSKKLFYLVSFILVLALAGTNAVSAAIVSEWQATDTQEDYIAYDTQIDNGTDDGSSSDLEMPWEDEANLSNYQVICLRFVDIQIPEGADITSANVQFTGDDEKLTGGPVNLIINGLLQLNPGTFGGNEDIYTVRDPKTTAEVKWSDILEWGSGSATPASRTPDISSVIQEIMAQEGWASGNALVLFIRDDETNPSADNRSALSDSPLLQIEYTVSYAMDPNPSDGGTGGPAPLLQWTKGYTAVYHDVYFGTNPDLGDADYMERMPFAMYWYIPGLTPGTTYYWRIDEVEGDGTTTHTGNVWSFLAAPFTAYNPDPPNGSKTAVPDAPLRWGSGATAATHDVYLGTSRADVAAGTGGTFKGNQIDQAYAPEGLENGTAYYWRIDEVEADGTTKYPGEVWGFKILDDPAFIGWWKFDEGQGDIAYDSSGFGNHGLVGGNQLWVANGAIGGALELDGSDDYVGIDSIAPMMTSNNFSCSAWIKTEQMDEGTLFGSNTGGDHEFQFGVLNGNLWVDDGTETEFPPRIANNQWHMVTYVREGPTGYVYVDGVLRKTHDAGNNPSSETRWSIGNEWDPPSPSDEFAGVVDDARFWIRPLSAEEVAELFKGDVDLAHSPKPANGSTPDINRAMPISWLPGENAAQHDVYFGTDEVPVEGTDASDTTGIYRGRQGATSYNIPGTLEWGSGPYYWRIDEYNTDGTISKGKVWSFSVADYLIVDDFEDYDVGNNEIWWSWIDGLGYPVHPTLPPHPGNGTGSMVGDETTYSYTEETIVHSGSQAMPIFYDNNQQAKLKYSEVEKTLSSRRDWTEQGVGVLTIWFQGVASNAAEPLYVALNGNAVVTHENPDAAQVSTWTQWNIDLQAFADQGVNLANVNTIAIGLGNKKNPVAGGSGTIYIDDIRLYRPAQ